MGLCVGLTGRGLTAEDLDQGRQETLVTITWAWAKAELRLAQWGWEAGGGSERL